MSKKFIIADTHFGHKNIITYENRPFADVDEMDGCLIDNWNSVVGKNDKIYILGDFALTSKERLAEIVHQLNGYKILILGNHDNYTVELYHGVGFNVVSPYPIIVNDWFILSHQPLYINANMPYANIFGHVHGNKQYRDFSKQSFCASCERTNFAPVELDYAIAKMMESGD